ncbi:hypothetical protein [Moorella sp. E306M]|uniref:hypothetical protein n=1 Tax=Moorella sp. E306M TaxID=2572683 RepID=UPI0010FFB6A4|nr:hypothetical protein [Moorella sp. E306M]GEA18487.1 hypothetical protein E306M_16240 [Moorella sp. E306M]
MSQGSIPIFEFISTAAITILALLNYFSVRASRQMAKEMREVRLAQFKPLLHPRLETGGGVIEGEEASDMKGVLNLVVENIGEGPALDVDLKVSGAVMDSWHTGFLAEGKNLSKRIPRPSQPHHGAKAPGQPGMNKEGQAPVSVTVEASYKDLFGNPIKVEVTYSLVYNTKDQPEVRLVRTILKG